MSTSKVFRSDVIRQKRILDEAMKEAARFYVENIIENRPNVLRVAQQYSLIHATTCVTLIQISARDAITLDPEPRIFEYDTFKNEPFYAKEMNRTTQNNLAKIVNEINPYEQAIVCVIINTSNNGNLVGTFTVPVPPLTGSTGSTSKKK